MGICAIDLSASEDRDALANVRAFFWDADPATFDAWRSTAPKDREAYVATIQSQYAAEFDGTETIPAWAVAQVLNEEARR